MKELRQGDLREDISEFDIQRHPLLKAVGSLSSSLWLRLWSVQVSWWESTVLIRKCAMAAAVAVFSASYAPMLYLSSILFIAT